MSWSRLNNPPVKEAVFDVRFVENSDVTVEGIKSFCDALSEEFPERNEIYVLNVQTNMKSSQATQGRQSVGMRMANRERSFILQIRKEGFTLSKLVPYISWEEIKSVVKPLIEKLLAYFPKIQFNYLGLRYVNNFETKLEQPPTDLFQILPSFPANLPQTIDGFLIQLQIPKHEYDVRSVITFSIQPIQFSKEELFKVILDISVFKHAIFIGRDIDVIFNEFERIRDFKNEIFFNAFTKDGLSKFQ